MIIYYPIAIYLAYRVYYFSSQANLHYQTSISYLNFSSQSELAWKSFLEALSLNLYDGASEIRDNIIISSEQAVSALNNATNYSIVFTILSFLYFIYLIFIKKTTKNQIIIHSIFLAFICLVVGISSTMLNLIAFRDLPVIGMVVLKFESKTVFTVLETFWLHSKYFVFTLILLFSVIVPIIKLSLSFLIALNVKSKNTSKFTSFLNAIGKWSMTDVFVVSILLAFFSMNIDESTDAWLGHGLYFFAIYSILSIIIGQLINNIHSLSVDEVKEIKDETKT